MKRLIMLIALPALTMMLVQACNQKTAVNEQGKELSMLQPANQVLHQGRTEKLTIMITRRGFDGPVKIDFDNLPRGVKVAEDEQIPAGDTARTFTLVAEDDAPAIEKHIVTVKAKAQDMKISQIFELTVRTRA